MADVVVQAGSVESQVQKVRMIIFALPLPCSNSPEATYLCRSRITNSHLDLIYARAHMFCNIAFRIQVIDRAERESKLAHVAQQRAE